MHQIFLCFLLVFFYVQPMYAGGNNHPFGAKQAGMAFTGITQHHLFSLRNNVASSAFLEKSSLGFTASNRYLFAQINEFSLVFSQPIKKLGTFSSAIVYFGYHAYNETNLSFAYSRRFGDKISAGVLLNYHRLAIEGYGAKSIFSFNAGLEFIPLEKFRIGISIVNPARQKLEEAFQETLSTFISIGCSFHPSENFMFTAEIRKDLLHATQFMLGIDYKIHPFMSIRAGVAANPILFSLGFGTSFHQFELDLASTYELNLGYSPQLSLSYKFNKKSAPKK